MIQDICRGTTNLLDSVTRFLIVPTICDQDVLHCYRVTNYDSFTSTKEVISCDQTILLQGTKILISIKTVNFKLVVEGFLIHVCNF